MLSASPHNRIKKIKAVSSTGVIEYEYDQGGKLITQTDEGAREEIRYAYNSAGRRTRMTGANRDVLYTYGKNGELLTVRDYGQGLSVSYTYDAMGREVSRQYGNGGRQDTLYDEAGRTIMVREISARGEILRAEGYVYDSLGRRSATVDETGRVTLYRYDGQSRLSAVLYPVSEALVASDEAEAQKSGTRLNGSFTLGERIFLEGDEYSACANRLEAMGYGMSRLLTSAHNQWRQVFTYDANGNRLTKTTSWGTIVYEYDGDNRLLGAGTLRYAYDADGNLLSETSPYGTKTYRYSGSNRMKESRVTDLEAKTEVLTSYAYDAFGRRTLVADDGGDTVRTMYDGLSFEVFHEGVAYADSSFASASSRSVPGSAMGSTNGRYVYIDDEADGRSSFVSNDSVRRVAVRYTGESAPLYAGGNRVAVNRSGNETTRGGRAYFGTDILGSVRSASGDDSVLEDRYEYDAFGVPYEGDFSSGTGAGYTGKPYDPITGLANYGYRDYSPVTASFTTVDPIRDGSNWFAYVNNDPVNYVDEWGLSASDVRIDVYRDIKSYSVTRDRNNPENVALDRIVITKRSTGEKVEINNVQTVANYPSTKSDGKTKVNNHYNYTVAEGDFQIKTGTTTSIAAGPAHIIINATTIDGRPIDENGLTPGNDKRHLIHSNTNPITNEDYNTPYSSGCFIPSTGDANDLIDSTLTKMGVSSGSIIDGTVHDVY